MAVGASVWASGNQVWNGKAGTLMANAINSPIKAMNQDVPLKVLLTLINSGIEKVCGVVEKYSASITSSISTLPNNVYRKNLIAAYSLRGPPQIPIRKYIGRSITSQNT